MVHFNLCTFSYDKNFFQNNFQVSHMKDDDVAPVNQLTLVEMLWTEELRILRVSAEQLSSLQAAFM